MKVDVGRLTHDETLELFRELFPNLDFMEDVIPIILEGADDIDLGELQAHIEDKLDA